MELVEPEYMRDFSCLAGECPDTCCSGWDIVFDEAACGRYKNSPDEAVQRAFYQQVLRNEAPTADGAIPFARVRLTKEQRCPFLCGDGLCFIQRRSEERNLSETCRTHPRVLRFWGQEYGELSLQVSCPHAADLILTDTPLSFFSTKIAAADLRGLRSRRQENQRGIGFRNFIIHILQHREYSLRERVLLANHFFWQAAAFSDENDAGFLALVDRYLEILADGGKVRGIGESAARQTAMSLEILRSLLLHRMHGIEMDAELSGIGTWILQHGELQNQVTERSVFLYRQAQGTFSQFFQEQAQLLENYLVNQVFKAGNLFLSGGGRQTWLLLVFQYALLQFLLLAAASQRGKAISSSKVRRIVQKLSKLVEHDERYLQQAAKFIEVLQLDNEMGMELLLRECG